MKNVVEKYIVDSSSIEFKTLKKFNTQDNVHTFNEDPNTVVSKIPYFECPPGKFRMTNSTISVCEICPAGQFQPSSGQNTCIQCTAGKYQSSYGSTDCLPVLPGKWICVSNIIYLSSF
jgi:uncharacterized cupin superfamily protein